MAGMWIRIKHNWFRNVLAMLQVAIAIAALSAVFIDVLPVLKPDPAESSGQFTVRFGARTGSGAMWTSAFLAGDADYLLEHGDAVAAATTFESSFQPVVRVGDDRYALRGLARANHTFADLMDLEVVAGTFFVAADGESERSRVAVVSQDLAGQLFGGAESALGETINVRPEEESMMLRGAGPADMFAESLGEPGNNVEVIGVFRAPEGLQSLGPISPSTNVMLLPLTEVSAGGSQRRLYASEILVKAKPGMEREAEEEIRHLLMARLQERGDDERTMDGRSLEIIVEPLMGMSQVRQARLANALVLGALGVAALFISSIAVFTTTLANLTQRTRYIGLGRSLGATRGRVVREVVAETALIAGVGGLIGAIVAFPLRATVLAPLLPGVVNAAEGPGAGGAVLVALFGVLLAAGVGAVAALYPAWTVAKLPPAEAWREGHA